MDGTIISFDDLKNRQALPLLGSENTLNITIDGQNDLLQVSDNFKSEGFTELLDSTLFSSGRVPTQFRLNEVEMDIDTLQETINQGISKDAELKIETTSLKGYLQQNLRDMMSGIEEIENQAIEISDQMLREGNLGLTELSVWAGDLAQMASNLKTFIHMFQMPTDQLRMGEKTFEEGIARLRHFTSLIIGSLQTGKKVNISDILQYDLAELVSELKGLFPTLITHLDSKLD